MATKKKSFDAVASSRRWRQATSRLLNQMSPEEQVTFLNRHRDTRQSGAKPKASRLVAHR